MTVTLPAATPPPQQAARPGRRRRSESESKGWLSEIPQRRGPRRTQALVNLTIRSVVMWAFSLVFLAPFVWMLASSLKRNIDVFTFPVEWIPDPVVWGNYVHVWMEGDPPMARFFANSITVSGIGLVGDLLTSSMAGYAFARLSFWGRDKMFLLYLGTAVIPGQLLLVPRFMFFQQLGLYDSLWALILPGVFTVFGTFLMRQAFLAAPAELGEAARIDGAGEWRVFWSVYLPQVRPTMAALAIISFVGSWNDYEGPLVMLSSAENYTVPLGLTRFVDAEGGLSAGYAMAASVSSIAPVLILFLILQRHFVEALARTGIK